MAESDRETEDTESGGLQRAWRSLVETGSWIADTFRGHAGVREIEDERK